MISLLEHFAQNNFLHSRPLQKRKSFLFGICMLFLISAYSQEIGFRRIDMSSGLSHNSALCFLQDSNGFMWVGTRDGLNRYDGIEFQTYKHLFKDSLSISNNHVNCIYQSSDGTIWIGTADGVNYYDNTIDVIKRCNRINGSNSQEVGYVRSIVELPDQNIWIGTTDGIYVFNKNKNFVGQIRIDPDIESDSNVIICFFTDSNNRLWVGTRKGIYRYDEGQFQRVYVDPVREESEKQFEIREITESEDGEFWIATEKHGTYSFEFTDHSVKTISNLTMENSTLQSNSVRTVLFRNRREIWIGTMNGLCLYNRINNTIANYNYDENDLNGLGSNSIRDIIKDNQGGTWIATYSGGIYYYHPQNFIFDRKTNLEKEKRNIQLKVVTSVFEDEEENLWIGTEGNGLYYYDAGNDKVLEHFQVSNSSLASNNVKSIIPDNQGNLWIATLNGLSKLDSATGKISNYTSNNSENSLNHNQVHAIYFENDKKLWIGTNGGGLQLFDPENESFRTIQVLSDLHVNDIFEDSKNRIWVGTQSGLSVFTAEDQIQIDIQSVLGEYAEQISYINFINEDSQANIWIGTQWQGLFLLRNKNVYWFNSENGLSDNTVNALLEGEQSQIWITTNSGLSRLVYYEDADGSVKIKSEIFTRSQGLQGMQFYPKSAVELKSGDMIFGGINGFNQFNEQNIKEFDFHPPVIFTGLRLNNKRITASDEDSPLNQSINDITNLVLNYKQRIFTIDFTGINFINPDKTFYRYRIKELDDDWIYLGKQRNINFTYFPVGTYKLIIQSSLNEEEWDGPSHMLGITVLPPWWKTWLAFLIYAVLFAAFLFVFFLFAQRWAKLKNQLAMEHFQRQKESELHEMKLKFFTDVSHELRTPLTLILAPLEKVISQTDLPFRLKNQLVRVQHSGFRMMQLINQILDLRKLETGHDQLRIARGNIIRFLTEISLAFKEIAESQDIYFEFIPKEQELSRWYDRNKLEIIVNNLLSNAFKFTVRGGKIELITKTVKGTEISERIPNLRKEWNYFQLIVRNEGEGIKPEDTNRLFKRFYTSSKFRNVKIPGFGIGLELTRRMVELHKGGISAESKTIGEGNRGITIFNVYLPLEKQYYDPVEIDVDYKNSEDPGRYINEGEIFSASDEVFHESFTQEGNPGSSMVDKLLIVEDNSEVRRFLIELFHEKYAIIEAENGKKGHQLAVDESPDLIISDIMMPVMNGIELCRKIKTDVRTSHIPVILLTARTALSIKYEGLETGADEYITKPFKTHYLLLKVKNLIAQRDLMREHFKREALFDLGSTTVTSIDEKLLKNAVEYILENISDPKVSVNKLSEHVGMSRVHFYRKIKALTNQTAVEFIRNIKIKKAAEILGQGKLSVKEVQYMVGFEDAGYFRECFKNQFGKTPTSFIQKETESSLN